MEAWDLAGMLQEFEGGINTCRLGMADVYAGLLVLLGGCAWFVASEC